MNTFLKATIIVLAILAVGLGGFWFFGNKINFNNEIDGDGQSCDASEGYFWCKAKSKCVRFSEELCPDVVAGIIDDIKQTTGVSLSDGGQVEFNWLVSVGDVSTDARISGIIYSAENISRVDYEKVEKYMNNNFVSSGQNVADGTEGGMRGYHGNYLVCHLNFRRTQTVQSFEGDEQLAVDNLKVSLQCGYFNRTTIPHLILKQIIREELAKKYNKGIDEVSVRLDRYKENYLAGSIFFGLEGQGEGGLFLATKINGKWELVFDGNGSVDCDRLKQEYQFPDEILKPNFCD